MIPAIKSFFLAGGLLLSVGCVTVETGKLPKSWPRVIRNPTSEQFSGVYQTTPAARTGSPESSVDEEDALFFFLTGITNTKASSCRIVESGGVLSLTTQNGSVEVTGTRQHSGSRKGALLIRKQIKRIVDPLANGVAKSKLYLYATEDGSLIGLREGYGAGLVIGVVPAFGSGKHWILWKRAEGAPSGGDKPAS